MSYMYQCLQEAGFSEMYYRNAHVPSFMFPLIIQNEPSHEKKQQVGFPTRSNTDRPVYAQKQASGLKFWI